MSKIKTITIMGKSGTGKSTLQLYLEKNFPKIFYNVKSKTTRQERKHDSNDTLTHIFVSEETYFKDKKEGLLLAEYSSPKGYYSYTTRDCFKPGLINLYSIDSLEYNRFIKREDFKTRGVYLVISEEERKKRFSNRESKTPSQEEHLNLDHITDNTHLFIIEVDNKTVEKIAQEIITIVKMDLF